MALEWGTDYDIRVNGIAPGPIEDTPGMSKLAPDEITSKAREYMPLYKLGEKWDIAMAALYLTSDAGQYDSIKHFFCIQHPFSDKFKSIHNNLFEGTMHPVPWEN